MRLRRDKTEDVMVRPSRRSSFLGDADARFFCGTEQTGHTALEILLHRGLRVALRAPQGFTPTGVRELIHQKVGPNENIKRAKNEYRSAGEELWKSRSVETPGNRGSHCAWKSRNRRGISTFPQLQQQQA